MFEDTEIILEGGGMRGVFTSGVLDYLMNMDFYTSDVIGVSAGSCNGIDYVSKQLGRSRDCFIIKDRKNRFMHLKNFVLHKNIMDMEKMFVEFPSKQFPFDFDTFCKSSMNIEIGVTNCITGQAEYLILGKKDMLSDMKVCRASCSMPRFLKEVYIKNIPYLDGGASDPIPIKHALEQKRFKKIILVLTQPLGYRKKSLHAPVRNAEKVDFRKYPELKKDLAIRPEVYNSEIELVEKLEKEGKIFAIRPSVKVISSVNNNTRKLTSFYNHGYKTMKKNYNLLMKYMEK